MREDGLGFERAIAEMGIPRSTAHRWRRFGKKNGVGLNAQWAQVAEGAQLAVVARAERLSAEALNDATLCDQCGKDALSMKDRLHHGRWVLSKLARADYGDKTEIQIRGEVEGLCEAVKPHMSAPAFAEMIHAFATVAGVDLGAGEADERDADDPLPLH